MVSAVFCCLPSLRLLLYVRGEYWPRCNLLSTPGLRMAVSAPHLHQYAIPRTSIIASAAVVLQSVVSMNDSRFPFSWQVCVVAVSLPSPQPPSSLHPPDFNNNSCPEITRSGNRLRHLSCTRATLRRRRGVFESMCHDRSSRTSCCAEYAVLRA